MCIFLSWQIPGPSALWRHGKKAPPLNHKVDTDSAGALILGSPASRIMRNQHFSYVYGMFYVAIQLDWDRGLKTNCLSWSVAHWKYKGVKKIHSKATVTAHLRSFPKAVAVESLIFSRWVSALTATCWGRAEEGVPSAWWACVPLIPGHIRQTLPPSSSLSKMLNFVEAQFPHGYKGHNDTFLTWLLEKEMRIYIEQLPLYTGLAFNLSRDPDAGKDCRQNQKKMAENEIVR